MKDKVFYYKVLDLKTNRRWIILDLDTFNKLVEKVDFDFQSLGDHIIDDENDKASH